MARTAETSLIERKRVTPAPPTMGETLYESGIKTMTVQPGPKARGFCRASPGKGRMTSMADSDAADAARRLTEEFIGQLRASTERLADLVSFGAKRPFEPGSIPMPGAMSAAQLNSIADSIAAQRRSIEVLKAQLSAFDEQLAALEQVLGPLAAWSKMWADAEQRLLNMGKPEAGN